MTLPWVRIDSNLASHDKILGLINDDAVPPARRWQAAFAYVCAIGWSADQGTDGHVPTHAQPFIHANKRVADLLVYHRLWVPDLTGHTIHNYDLRQELTAIADTKRQARQQGAQRAACTRWHGPDCWGPKGCSRT